MQFFGAVLTEPLERGVRLRNEAADRHRATRLLGVLLPDLDDVACEFGDAEGVLIHLGRQSDEEVQLHPPPTLRIRALDRRIQILFGDELVDDLTQPPRTTLGRKGQSGASHFLDLAGDADRERVDAQRRQRHTDVAAPDLVIHQIRDEVVDPTEVGARQGRERDFVVARAAQAVRNHAPHLLGGALAHRPRDHPGLTEPTPSRATSEQLDIESVVDDLDQRDKLFFRVRPIGEVRNRALVHHGRNVGVTRRHRPKRGTVELHRVHRRHVDTGDRGQGAKEADPSARTTAALPRPDAFCHLSDGFFAVADHKGVNEVRHRFRVERRVAASNDQWVRLGTLL